MPQRSKVRNKGFQANGAEYEPSGGKPTTLFGSIWFPALSLENSLFEHLPDTADIRGFEANGAEYEPSGAKPTLVLSHECENIVVMTRSGPQTRQRNQHWQRRPHQAWPLTGPKTSLRIPKQHQITKDVGISANSQRLKLLTSGWRQAARGSQPAARKDFRRDPKHHNFEVCGRFKISAVRILL